MKNKLLFFDVETPNNKNDKICKLGLIIEENNQIIYENSFLINPETDFSFINSRIHGIKPSMVSNKPTFPEIWKEIENYFNSSLIIGFNTHFDLYVLKKTLENYQIKFNNYTYLDTFLKSKSTLNLEKYSLDKICNYFNYEFINRHDAFEDTKACYFIYKQYEKQGLWNDSDFILLGSSDNNNNNNRYLKTSYSEVTQSMQEFKNLIEQILLDNDIELKELQNLKFWINCHQELSGQYPFDEIKETLEDIFDDNIVTEEELINLKLKLSHFINPTNNSNKLSINDLNNKNVCLTGDFNYGSKDDIKNIIINAGGFITKSVILKTDFVIVGGLGSSAWSYGNFGNKVKKALELQEKGHHIQIIHEKDVNFK